MEAVSLFRGSPCASSSFFRSAPEKPTTSLSYTPAFQPQSSLFSYLSSRPHAPKQKSLTKRRIFLPHLVASMQKMEETYIMIKPDGVQRGLVGEIISRFEKKGFKLTGLKLFKCPQELAEAWEGDGVVASARKLIGATNPLQAEPGTIRGDLAVQTGRSSCNPLTFSSDEKISHCYRFLGSKFFSGTDQSVSQSYLFVDPFSGLLQHPIVENPIVEKMVQRQYGKKGKGARIQRLFHSETSAAYIGNSPDEIGVGNYCVASCGDCVRGHKCRLKLYDSFVPLAFADSERDYLVDSCGELFMVRRFSMSKLEVFRMDFSCQDWEKVQHLGDDRVFFLSSQYSVSLCAAELGIKGNCIYFTEEDNKSLYFFDNGHKSLSVSHHQPNSGPVWFTYSGLLPVLRLNKKPTCEQLGEDEDEEVNDTNKVSRAVGEDSEEGKSIFLELPVELQESIAKRVSVGQDYMNFRAVCRKWRSIAPPCRWRYNASTTIPYPWLVLFQPEKDTCNFRDPRDNRTYHLTITAEVSPDCVIQFAKDDYLLISQGDWVHVYKLDNLGSKWVKWSSLGHLMVFVNETSSLAMKAKEEAMSNKIYFPFFTKPKGNNLFYSLESGKFQSFDENDHSSGDLKLHDTTQSLNCAWVYEDETVLQAFKLMREKGVGGVSVVERGGRKAVG
ncbi:hypothetical protein RHMOL_Rhmol12G0204200 [Rhododendron molle]|uniref:Uncharacterized protein n=1 Tax=Rhododendron molle TaxID=49168 RepID=A0ACC0LLP3_RHOML|nr:hypothetical protein RHMOL_Rhmol12G0204200 [Rhododendron molle]